jgi:hypothetical protein
MQLLVYVFLLSVVVIGALRSPAMALCGGFLLFGLKQLGQFSHPWLAVHSSLTNVVIGGAILASLALQVVKGESLKARFTPTTAAVFALYGYALVSLVWVSRMDLSLERWRLAYPYILTMVLMAPLLLKAVEEFRMSLALLTLLGGVLVADFLFFGEWGIRGLLVYGNNAREGNPLAIAQLGGVVCIASLYVTWPWFQRVSWPLRLLMLVLCLSIILKSGSRGQLIALMLSLLATLPIAFRLTRAKGLALGAVALTLIFGTLLYMMETREGYSVGRWTSDQAESDVEGRLSMAAALMAHWSESLVSIVFGLGSSASFDPRVIGFYPHIVVVEVLGEEGVVGLALYLSVLALSLRSARRASRLAVAGSFERGVLAALLANLIFVFITSFKEGSFLGNFYFPMFAILLARYAMLVEERGEARPEISAVRQPAVGRSGPRFL